jgi:hypothetical protein
VGQATDDNMIRRIRIEFWITKAADKHSEYVMLIAFLRSQWLSERASMLRHTYIACLVVFDSSSLQNITGDKRPELRAQLLACLVCRRYEFKVFDVHFFLC